ncbi:MAG: hypothetical protein CL840_06785 [Crocinitomicaceae bacterium]|nr:hypothetical protein [Crocinitomicaceae bacterium]|tara:strand:+ start:5991 stop:6419 length:429 start_codon:yes stop_codon:yes gene_type:complete
MIKTMLLKSLAVIVSVLTIVASVDWSINAHFCGDQLINLAFIGEAEGCGMDEARSTCEPNPLTESYKGICCSNRDIVFTPEDVLSQLTAKKGLKKNQNTVELFDHSLPLVGLLKTTKTLCWGNSSPPWFFKDLFILHKVFRL